MQTSANPRSPRPWILRSLTALVEALVRFAVRRRNFAGLFALAVGVFFAVSLASSPVFAAELETETIRLGGDYGTVAVDDADACAAACENDPRCLAFTFIRDTGATTGQCRLKNTLAPAYTNRCCTSGVSTVGAAAAARLPASGVAASDTTNGDETAQRAARSPECRLYVSMALAQQVTNTRYGCGNQGTPWSSDASVHRRFCAGASNDQRGQAVRGREAQISRCLLKAAVEAIQ